MAVSEAETGVSESETSVSDSEMIVSESETAASESETAVLESETFVSESETIVSESETIVSGFIFSMGTQLPKCHVSYHVSMQGRKAPPYRYDFGMLPLHAKLSIKTNIFQFLFSIFF